MHRQILLVLFSCCLVSLPCASQLAQAPTKPPTITFSVASIRPSAPETRSSFQSAADGLIMRSVSTMSLIQFAYGLPEERFIVDAPDWAKSDKYDLSTKVDDADLSSYRAMRPVEQTSLLRSVLIDRFKLAFHNDSKAFSEYALVVKKGGPNSANLRPSIDGGQERHWRISQRYQLDAKGIPIQDLCNMLLSTEARQLVRDQTGLAGKYDFQLRWSRENPDGSANTNSDAPEIFTAVQEQLGLQIVPRRIDEKILKIDHLDRPTLN